MPIPIQPLEAQLERTISVLEQIFQRHEQFLSNFSTAIETYIEDAEIVKSLSEAAGAEIEAKGRASPQTVFGKRYGLLAKGRGKGLAQYVAEKSWAASMLLQFIAKERGMAAEQARYDFSLLQETAFEEKDITEMLAEYRANKWMQKKIRAAKKLLNKCAQAIGKEARRDKEIQAMTAKETAALEKTLNFIRQEGASLRSLTWLVGAGYFYKRLSIALKEEAVAFQGFVKEEIKLVDDLLRDVKTIFLLLKEHIAFQKDFGRPSPQLMKEEEEAKLEEARAKRLRQLTKRMDKIQKSLRKVKKAAAKYGIKISTKERALLLEERELIVTEEKLGTEIGDTERLIESITRFSTMVSSLGSNISALEIRFKPIMIWINQAVLSAYKAAVKNPAAAPRFLDRVVDFAQKGLLPALEGMAEKEQLFYKELLGEEGIIRRLELDLQTIQKLEKVGFVRELQKLSSNLKQLDNALINGHRQAVKDLRSDIAELQKEFAAMRTARAPGVQPSQNELNLGDKIAELRAQLSKRQQSFQALRAELPRATLYFKQADVVAPKFNYGRGFLFSLFGLSFEGRMLKGTQQAIKKIGKGEKEEHAAIQALREWFQNKTNLKLYANFSKTMELTFKDYLTMLKNLYKSYAAIASMENQLTFDIRRAEDSANLLESGANELRLLAEKYSEIFGEQARSIVTEIQEVVVSVKNTVAQLRKAETAIATCSHTMPLVESHINSAEKSLPELEKITAESERNARKASKFFGREVQMRFT